MDVLKTSAKEIFSASSFIILLPLIAVGTLLGIVLNSIFIGMATGKKIITWINDMWGDSE